MDTVARGLLNAARMIEDGCLDDALERRYAGWEGELGRDILGGRASLAELSERVLARGLDPRPVSGRQEQLENLVGRYL